LENDNSKMEFLFLLFSSSGAISLLSNLDVLESSSFGAFVLSLQRIKE